MLDGEYEKAIDALKKETAEDKRREVGEEIAFCLRYCAAQLAFRSGPTQGSRQVDVQVYSEQPQQFPLL